MKKFVATASSITYYTLVIEAETEEEAWDIAHNADGGDFEEQEFSGDWDIYSVEEAE